MLPTDLLPKAQQIIARLAAIDYENPKICEQRIRNAFSQHLIALNQRDRFVEIYRSFYAAFDTAWEDTYDAAWKVATEATERAVWNAAFGDTWEWMTRSGASDLAYKFAGYAAWDTPCRFAENAARDIAREAALEAAFDGDWNGVRGTGTEAWWAVAKAVEIVNSTTNSPEYDRFCAVWMPFVDAIEAGLFCFWVTPTKVIVLTTPVMRIEPVMRIQDYRLHADGQPAVQWSDWECYYFWHGTQIPQKYGAVLSENWRSQWLLKEPNAELRRVLIQGIGYDRIVQELEAVELDTWREYSLLKIQADVDVEPIHLLKMTCPSTNHIHVLRVPPDLTSAREAIRWVNCEIDPEAFVVET